MSSKLDILELKMLKKVISRKKVSKIKKKYYKAERKVIKKLYIDDDENFNYIIKCNFSEFKRKYFGELYSRIDTLINEYIDGIQPALKDYIYERDRNRIFEVLSLINSIFKRNSITWALFSDYIVYKGKSTYPGIVNISIAQECRGKVNNILNVIGERRENNLFVINDVSIRISYGYIINENRFPLEKENIDFCLIDNESFPVLKDKRI